MRVEVFRNKSNADRPDRAHFLGDEMELVYVGSVVAAEDSEATAALEAVREVVSEGDRYPEHPTPALGGPIGPGDVITLFKPKDTRSFALEPHGFRELSLLIRATTAEEILYNSKSHPRFYERVVAGVRSSPGVRPGARPGA